MIALQLCMVVHNVAAEVGRSIDGELGSQMMECDEVSNKDK